MKDMNDYIRAYSQLAPLLNDYDRQLERITDLYNQARERDRRLLRIERLYRRPHLANWEIMSEILDVMHALNKVFRQGTSVVQNMAQLSADRNECSSGMNTSFHSKRRKRVCVPGY